MLKWNKLLTLSLPTTYIVFRVKDNPNKGQRKMNNLIKVSLGKNNEIIVNNGKLSVNVDKAYVCNGCGDITATEPQEHHNFTGLYCSLCHPILNKCNSCTSLVSGEGGTWTCGRNNNAFCVDIVDNCIV